MVADTLHEHGYSVVRGVLDAARVEAVRAAAQRRLDAASTQTLPPAHLLGDATLSAALFSPALAEGMRQISADHTVLLPNFTVRRDLYIGWHTDDQFTPLDEDASPGVLQCNVYLQANDVAHGGGIDVCTGTHRLLPADKLARAQAGPQDFLTVPTLGGDLFVFDYRVIHRSTVPSVSPRPGARLALQWTLCKSSAHADAFMAYLRRRQDELLHLSDFTAHCAGSYLEGVFKIRWDSLSAAAQAACARFGWRLHA